jgi:hypothetical protein
MTGSLACIAVTGVNTFRVRQSSLVGCRPTPLSFTTFCMQIEP